MTVADTRKSESVEVGSGQPSLHELSKFLARYSSALMGSGANCIRLVKNVTRIANTYGKEVEVLVLPKHVNISVWDDESLRPVTTITKTSSAGISFNVNTLLSRLSWEIADDKIEFDTATKRFEEILANDHHNRWVTLVLVTLANASFCRLFGGDPVAMGVVAVATFAGYLLKMMLVQYHTDPRLMILLCSFVSSIIGASASLYSIGDTPMIAVTTSVLYLVPGIPFLNSFSDLLARHYLCAIGRFADAVVCTCCLSAGLCAGMYLMHLGMF